MRWLRVELLQACYRSHRLNKPISPRAFVECDEEPDLGRIFIPLERLKRYRLTLAMLASFIRQALAISSTSFIERSKSISLGRIKGRYRAAYRRFELMISHTPSAVA